jgi:hypothetical protein
VLDVGADVRADPLNLAQYAVMGAEYARVGLDVARPRVGLLNVGSEEMKGRPEIRSARDIIETAAGAAGYEWVGFVEGGDIARDRADVVVTDGFTGNVALKTAEGTAAFIGDELRGAFRHSVLSKLAALAARSSLKRMQRRIDPRRVNGGVFLGLMGAVVKAHGGSDATGVASALALSARMARTGFAQTVAAGVARLGADFGPGGHDSRGEPMTVLRSVPLGCGRYLPERIVANDYFAEWLDTSDEWIVARTGIRRRRFAAEGETTSDLAVRAAERALADAGMTAADLDALIVATATPDNTFPSTATRVQTRIGMRGGFAFDVQAVCAGFIFALTTADALIRAGQARTVMVIGRRNLLSDPRLGGPHHLRAVRRRRRAVILGAAEGEGSPADRGVIATALHSDGAHKDILYVDGGPSTTGSSGKLRMLGARSSSTLSSSSPPWPRR